MKQLFFVLLFFISINLFSQDSIPYSRDYEFREGVFLTIDQFRQNRPVPKSSIVSSIPKNQLDFLTQVMEQKNFIYKDSAGIEQKVETKTAWGYCQNRTIFVNSNNHFNRVGLIGTLCHFNVIVITSSLGFTGPGGVPASYEEIHQVVLDTETNKVQEFNVKNMETILSKDVELYTQFMALKKRQKTDAIFIYLRKYNEKHPLYLAAK